MKAASLKWCAPMCAWALCLLAVPTAFAAPAPPAPTPPAHLLDIARPLGYDLQLTLIPSADKFSGRVAIDLNVLQPTQIIWLDALHLDVHRATLTVNGRSLLGRVVVAHDAVGIRLPQTIPAGRANLVLEYDGSFERQSTEGMMKVKEQDDWYIATDLEPDYARRVVPCFDELRAKAPWKLTLEVPIGLAAFGNQPEVSEEAISTTMKRVHFSTSPAIASYVLAVAVGPFDVVDGGRGGAKHTPIRILVPRGTAAMARYAADTTGRILALTEEEVAQPYPYDKLDVLAMPGIDRYGAMENVGLIVSQADTVLAASGHDTPYFQQFYAATLAHEIAHMWFGNSVTPAAWNDLWLNESFANWMTPKTVARLNPQWQQEFQIDDDRTAGLMADRLLSAQALRPKDDSSEAAESAFNPIVYSKGSAVLRMVEHWIGEDRFRDGIRAYLKAHAGGNASADDLVAALSAAADPHVAADVAPMMQGYLDQPGAPGLEVGLQCPEPGKGPVRLDLNQFRFAPRARVAPQLPASQMPAAAHWLMPVCFQYGEGGDYGESCTVMHESHVSLPLPDGESCPDWVVSNTDGYGYVISLLRDPLTARLDHAPLLPGEAIPVLNDARVLVASDAVGADSAMTLALRFANGRQPLVSLASLKLAEAVPAGLIDAADARDSYARFLRKAYGARAEALGWQVKPGEREVDDLLRVDLLPALATSGSDPILRSEADRLAREDLAGKSELGPELGPVLYAAAINGNQDLFDLLVNAASKAPSSPRLYEYRALGRFRDPKLLDAAFDLAMSDRLEVRDATVIFDAASTDPAQQMHVADYVKTHFDAFDKRFGNADEIIAKAYGNLCDRAARADLDRFIAGRPAFAKGSYASVLEKDDLCEAGRDLQVQRIKNFLAKEGS